MVTFRSTWGAMVHIDKVIRRLVEEEGKRRFVIYTNGLGGALAGECLRKYSVSPQYTIDNLSIEQAKQRNNENTYFLICSWNSMFGTEIRRVIYEAFPEEQIIDIFREEDILPTEEEICDVLRHVEGYIK